MSHLPNFTCLQRPPTPPLGQRSLAVGVRHYTSAGKPELRCAEDEADAIARLHGERGAPTASLLGPHATRTALDARARDAGNELACLHLAVHGESVDSDTPLESYLLLHDSRVDGIDVAGWHLPGATVVLSACSSGQRAHTTRRMDELPGDDMLGLQAAFHAAGARHVLGALWPVVDKVAQAVTLGVHGHLVAGATADVALQRALVEHLDRATLLHRESRSWAPFLLSTLGVPGRLFGET